MPQLTRRALGSRRNPPVTYCRERRDGEEFAYCRDVSSGMDKTRIYNTSRTDLHWCMRVRIVKLGLSDQAIERPLAVNDDRQKLVNSLEFGA